MAPLWSDRGIRAAEFGLERGTETERSRAGVLDGHPPPGELLVQGDPRSSFFLYLPSHPDTGPSSLLVPVYMQSDVLSN